MILERFIVSGRSMEPSFSRGDKLLVSGLVYKFSKPKVNDVIVLKDPRDGRLVLKRIRKIAEDVHVVLGDNEKESTDSRVFGTVSSENIVGKVILRYKRG